MSSKSLLLLIMNELCWGNCWHIGFSDVGAELRSADRYGYILVVVPLLVIYSTWVAS